MTLPRPWIPLGQDDDIDTWTEDMVEERVQELKQRIEEAQQTLRKQVHRIEIDVEKTDVAEHIVEDLVDAHAPTDLVQETNTILQHQDELVIADLHRGEAEAQALKRMHDEMSYGQAWLTACAHVRDLAHETEERLTSAIEQIVAAATHAPIAQDLVVLALPSGDEKLDLHYVRTQTVQIGERLIAENTEITIKKSRASQPPNDEPNIALKVAFKIAQFAYYALILARYAGDALKLALTHAHTALEVFLPMLPSIAKSIV